MARLPDEKTSLDTTSSMWSSTEEANHHHTHDYSVFVSSSTNRFNQNSHETDQDIDLAETKRYLRDQLREIKQQEQANSHKVNEECRNKKMIKEEEVKSCIVLSTSSQRNRVRSAKSNKEQRPQSSPGMIDTRTRIRLNASDLERIRLMSELNKTTQSQEKKSAAAIPGFKTTAHATVSKNEELIKSNKNVN